MDQTFLNEMDAAAPLEGKPATSRWSVHEEQPHLLRRLLGGASPERFFESTWERHAVVLKAALLDRIGSLLTLADFEALMLDAASTNGLNVVDGSSAKTHPMRTGADGKGPSSVYAAYDLGRTIVLGQMQHRCQPIAHFCRRLEFELVQQHVLLARGIAANVYLTPAQSQGLDIHHDDHCVFVVQLTGRKHWRVYAPTTVLPLDSSKKPLTAEEAGPPVLELELEPGDVLYIPRGHPHVARTTASGSMHLTLALFTVTWLQIVEEALRTQPALRRSVPPSAIQGGAQAHFDDNLRPALEIRDLDRRIGVKASHALSSLPPLACNRLEAIDRLSAVSGDTCVERVPEVPCMIQRFAGHVLLTLPGASLAFPIALQETIAFVSGKGCFRAVDLPTGGDTAGAVGLVRMLIKRGLLRVVEAAEASRHVYQVHQRAALLQEI